MLQVQKVNYWNAISKILLVSILNISEAELIPLHFKVL